MQADDGPDFRSAIADQASKIQLPLPAFTPLQDARNDGYPAFGRARIRLYNGKSRVSAARKQGRDIRWLTISSAFTLVPVTGRLSN